MFDEIFELFERKENRGRAGEGRGRRGFFARLFGGGDGDHVAHGGRHDRDTGDRNDRREPSRRHRRDTEEFDLGD